MKAIKLFALAAACIALFASCNKSSDPTPGGYYVKGINAEEYSGPNAVAQLAWNTALHEAFGSGVIYKNAENDKRASNACDKVYELNKHFITISFELYFQEAAPEGKTGTRTTVKRYDPAK